MKPNAFSIRIALVAVLAVAGLALAASVATAATRSMTGSLHVANPSAGVEAGPGVYGRKVGGANPVTFPPTDGAKEISVDGTGATTFVGRQVTIPAGRLDFTGVKFRAFPAFSNVGQTTKVFSTSNELATFAENGGALASCPGPGCT